jgi:hypothetical protein
VATIHCLGEQKQEATPAVGYRVACCPGLKLLLDRGFAHTGGRRAETRAVDDRVIEIQRQRPRHIPAGNGVELLLPQGLGVDLSEGSCGGCEDQERDESDNQAETSVHGVPSFV